MTFLVDHEMLRHQVGVEEHMRNYNEKLRHIMYKESMVSKYFFLL